MTDDTVTDYEKGPRVTDYEKGDDTVTVTLAQWKALTDRCNGGATVGRLRPITYALLGFVREAQHILATQRREVLGARGLREQDVVRARHIEQAARKWVGGA